MNNKISSDLQEKTIAKSLGWYQVSGSGARPFKDGDVVCNDWLGECKTHNNPGHKILFKKSVWNKIYREATINNRYPVYFVDDGSQKLFNTYCCIDKFANPFGIVTSSGYLQIEPVPFKLVTSADNVSFSAADFCFNNKIFTHQFDRQTAVIIMQFSKFKDLISEA